MNPDINSAHIQLSRSKRYCHTWLAKVLRLHFDWRFAGVLLMWRGVFVTVYEVRKLKVPVYGFG